ncbi:acyl-CoA mutase large subunit family protein [Vulgatibacter incomptus]|uniref:Methylmalonyl-CoA mutase n=1 Tax=Vulgatibacter incomptus TaxID=1391653 RepID=A0A0K1PA31_9BACT|nr:methylmalonyl-CoA mutase family protein [Vulgatibacter incomptus]AKU90375.1 Methylmalonyl-CoA mutase [Vulgatibacter incomptus]
MRRRIDKAGGGRSDRAPAQPVHRTRSGTAIRPVYGPTDVKRHPPPPGEFPFTRGIHADMYLGKPWTMRQYAGFGTPAETNRRFLYLLEAGQTGLSLALDLPTQLGLDSDDPEAAGEVGKVGVAIDSLADMERVFSGLPLDRVSTSMTINATAPILLAMYEAVARKAGVPADRISGTVQNDLLKEFGARGAWIFPIDPSMRLAIDLVEDTVERLPRFNPISIASHYRDAGATPAEEMAFTLSAGKSYVDALLARGLDPDRFGKRISFFFYTYANFFEEVAKYRAGRRIWANHMKSRGASDPQAQRLRAACVCGGHSLTRAEPLNNLARLTLEAFAVACGGLQSVFTAAYDEAFAIPTELSSRTSLRIQQILALETEVAKTADPLGGSYFVEALTDDLEGEILRIMDEVDARGGMVEALRSGWLQTRIGRRAYEWQKGVEDGSIPVVGVNVHATEGSTEAIEAQVLSREAEEEKKAELRKLREGRDGAAVERTLARVEDEAGGSSNLMPAIREAVLAYATTGEIAGALRKVFGTYRPPSQF